MKKSEKDKLELEYHAEALHENCKGCHRQFNKKYKPKKAPTTCTKCHAKKTGDKDEDEDKEEKDISSYTRAYLKILKKDGL